MKWSVKLETVIESPDRYTAWQDMRKILDRDMPLALIISVGRKSYTGNLVALNAVKTNFTV